MAVGSKGINLMNLTFSNNEIEQVTKCKCLGVFVKWMRKTNENIFTKN